MTSELAEKLAQIGNPGSVFLETVPRAGFPGKTLLFRSPLDVIRCIHGEQVETALSKIDEAVGNGYFVAGYLGYEAGAALQGISYDRSADRPEDLLWLGIYEAPIELDRDYVEAAIFQDIPGQDVQVSGSFSVDLASYHESISKIKSHIREGDVYQINYTAPFQFDTPHSALELYALLRQRQRVDYAALINTGSRTILSLSPELFFSRAGNRLTARPMKGTASRGSDENEDQQIRLALQADSKNRAENLMIVDLIRNDLSRVCQPGSVQVSDLFTAETYETVIQMTSTVHGDLRDNTTYSDIFRAIYPCGSITGAPKLKAMEIIHAVERGRRGVYCGTVGYISPNNEAVFNVAIRTIDFFGQGGRMGIGSGIVWDSDSDSEYKECLLKAKFLSDSSETETSDPFVILETMLWDSGIELRSEHIARMVSTAHRFGYPCDVEYLQSELSKLDEQLSTPTKIRVELDRQGRFAVERHAIEQVDGPLKVVLSDQNILSTDVFRRYKTSKRKLYNSEFRRVAEDGYDEVLFLNEHGEVAEGSRTNVFVKIDGKYYTPPIESGALPGVFRQQMLDSSAKFETRKLHLKDMFECDGLYICNAVLGWREAILEKTN